LSAAAAQRGAPQGLVTYLAAAHTSRGF